MKKTIFMFAAALAAMVSCQKAENESVSPNLTKITVVAENSLGDPETKVTVGEQDANGKCPVLWQEGDRVCLIDRTANLDRNILAETRIPAEYNNCKSANLTFEVDFTKYPNTKTLGLMICREGFSYNATKELPQDQVQKGLGAEKTNFMKSMYGYTRVTRTCRDNNNNIISNLSFTVDHAFAYVKVPFWSKEYAGYKVTSMILTNEDGKKRVTGRMTIDGSKSADQAVGQVYVSYDKANLTFSEEVTVPGSEGEADAAWFVAMPTDLRDETASTSVYSVTFNLMDKEGSTATAVVRFKTNLKAQSVNVLKVGEILPSDITASENINDDFFKMYQAGKDIKMGDLVVNKVTYPSYSLKKPSELTLALLQAGGLVFIADEENPSKDLSTSNQYESCPHTGKQLVLIGCNKKAGRQPEIKFKQWRTYGDLYIKNVKLTCNYTSLQLQLFAKSSTDANQTILRLQDCSVDMTMAKYLVEDMANSSGVPYGEVSIDNCVVKMSDQADVIMYRMANGKDAVNETVSITNNVIYTPSLNDFESQCVRINNDRSVSGLTVNVSGNTLLNLHGHNGIIRRGSTMGGVTVGNNLVVADNTANNPVLTKDYAYATDQNTYVMFLRNYQTTSAGSNFLTTINYTGLENTIKKPEMSSLTKVGTDIVGKTVNPFTSLNYTTGYFPVDATVVTNGAGASYDTKYFVVK